MIWTRVVTYNQDLHPTCLEITRCGTTGNLASTLGGDSSSESYIIDTVQVADFKAASILLWRCGPAFEQLFHRGNLWQPV
jgi:hypothetical protein